MKILIGKDTCTAVLIVALFVIAKTRQQQDVEQPKYPSTDEWIHKMWCIHNGILWRVLAQLCPTLCDSMDCSPPGSSVHGIFQVRNTGVGCHSLLQGLFLTQGSNPYLSFFWICISCISCTGRMILYHLSHLGSQQNISHRKEWNNATCNNMDGTRHYHVSAVSQTEKDIHDITHSWNLKKWYRWTYKTETDPQTQQIILWLPKVKRGRDKLGVWD